MSKSPNLLAALRQRSVRPLENPAAINRYLRQSAAGSRPITFYNWECPPRTMSKTADGRPFVNYDVDLAAIFQGQNIDAYTELPRVITQRLQETNTLNWLASLGLRFSFVKVIADTNAAYLTPDSLDILGPNLINQRFDQFQSLIAGQLASYPVQTGVIRFTNLIRPYLKTYDQVYRRALAILQTSPDNLVEPSVIAAQIERTKHHMGMTDPRQIRDFALKTIASYAAEGIVFSRLSTTDQFANCVWLNNHEVDDRTITITNFYRRLRGLGPLPMILI